MKLLQVISSFPPANAYGGPTKLAFDLCKGLAENGHDVTVYTSDVLDSSSRFKPEHNPEWMDGIEVYRFKNLSNYLAYKNFPIAPSIITTLNSNLPRFDIVHLHEYRSHQAIFTHHFAKKHGIPYVLQAHGSVPIVLEKQRLKSIYDSIWGQSILKDAKKLISVSKYEALQYEHMGFDKNKIVIIPNAINEQSLAMTKPLGSFRKSLDISDNAKLIVFVGRIHGIKGIDFLIKSFYLLTNELRDVILAIVGPDSGYGQVLRNLVKDLKIEDKVAFADFTDDVSKVYYDADLLVYPSIYEIFGMVPFEAISCGTPVIVTTSCGCGDLIDEAKCGFLVKYGDVEGLKEKMKYLIENPEEGYKTVVIGKKYIMENLSLNTAVSKTINLYKDLI
jgi:glycosyltransferase involved in cell wall biosynthesis